MKKLIYLCLISLQLADIVSESQVFKHPQNVIADIFNVFASNFTEIFLKDEVDGKNDQICMEQVNTIISGLNNSELWAIKSECFV